MISLQKGQKVSLSKEAPGLSKIIVGLGWDVMKKRGLFGFGSSSGQDCDLDASVICCRNGFFSSKDDLVYFGNKHHSSGAIKHCGDNLTGEGDGDDEQIIVELDKVPADIDKIIVVVNIYSAHSRKQDFGMVENAYIRLVNNITGQEICRCDLSEDYGTNTALVMGELYRHNGDWKFKAIEAGFDNGLSGLAGKYGLDAH